MFKSQLYRSDVAGSQADHFTTLGLSFPIYKRVLRSDSCEDQWVHKLLRTVPSMEKHHRHYHCYISIISILCQTLGAQQEVAHGSQH